jgi:hypothetical protein
MPGQHYFLFESDPKPTQSFLLMQPGIIEADVWFSNHQLMAEITVSDEASWTSDKILDECKKKLGIQGTPSVLKIMSVRLRAA